MTTVLIGKKGELIEPDDPSFYPVKVTLDKEGVSFWQASGLLIVINRSQARRVIWILERWLNDKT